MTQSVFVLQHLHVHAEDDEDYKFIGVYGSHESALLAVERLRLQQVFVTFLRWLQTLMLALRREAGSTWMNTASMKTVGPKDSLWSSLERCGG